MNLLADIYRALGHDVEIPTYRLRPRFEDRAGYGDAFDLRVDRWRLEVKWRTIPFSCCEDYPYQTVFVDRVGKADSCTIDAYICLDDDLSHCLLIGRRSRPHWQISDRWDATKGYGLRVYECPKELVRFRALADIGIRK